MRERALVTDIDRIAAARVAADHLRNLITEPNGRWVHFIDSGGGVISELDKRALKERHTPESLGASRLSGAVVSRKDSQPVLPRPTHPSPRRNVSANAPATSRHRPASPHVR